MTSVEFNFQVAGLQDHLRNFAQSLTLSSDDSKDLVQDTILKAFRYRDKFVDPANLKAWLFTIMKNTFTGFKYKEIAEKLSIPIGTVKSRIFAARKILAVELKDYKQS